MSTIVDKLHEGEFSAVDVVSSSISFSASGAGLPDFFVIYVELKRMLKRFK